MADAVDNDNQYYGSITNLCEHTELNRRTVQRTIQALVDGGWLIPEYRSGRTSRYQLNLERQGPTPERGGTVTRGTVSPVAL